MGMRFYDIKKNLPKEREDVIVRLCPVKDHGLGLPAAYVWGYLRYFSGKPKAYYFVTPGVGRTDREVTHWGRFIKDGFIEQVQGLEQLMKR